MSTMKYISIITLCLLVIVAYASTCGVPSELWCSNEETAFKCGVYKQCLENDWARKAKQAILEDRNVSLVEVDFCFESMCPDCKNFMAQQLYPAYQAIGSILDYIQFIPFGNAEEKQVGPKRWNFTCQHGPDECFGNMLESCTLKLTPYEYYVPWLHCIESSPEIPQKAAQECAKKHPSVPTQKALDCVRSNTLGNQYEHEMAQKTNKLCPNHQYVPWVMVNGVHSPDAERNFLKTVCDAFKGPKPAGCKGV